MYKPTDTELAGITFFQVVSVLSKKLLCCPPGERAALMNRIHEVIEKHLA